MKVELVYDNDCPNVAAARASLLRAFEEAGLPAKWQEWNASSADTPADVKGFGSPTVLVDGKDVAGTQGAGGRSCRVYSLPEGGLSGVPPASMIASALKQNGKQDGWCAFLKRELPVLPAIVVALLPNLACPACWPAYVGLLSSVGLGFLISETYLLPLTAAFLLIALAVLGIGAKKRRGYGPFFLGLLAMATILLGKFAFAIEVFLYVGIAVLVAASIWNAWPNPRSKSTSCPACAQAGGAES